MVNAIVTLPAFAVIGKEGLCHQGHNIVQDLWADARRAFHEVAGLGILTEAGLYRGFWGAMSDEGRTYQPWTEGFTRGLYLAGVEVPLEAEAPAGWVKWVLPARQYLVVEVPKDRYAAVFQEVLQKELPARDLQLCGAVCDFTDPATGRDYLYVPITGA